MHWNLDAKIKLIFGVIVLFLFFLGIIAYLSIRRLESNTEWIDHPHRVIQSLQKVYADLKDAQANYAEYLLTQKSGYSRNCKSEIESIREGLDETDKIVSDDSTLQKDMSRLAALMERRLTSMQVGLAYMEAGRADLALGQIQGVDEKKNDREIKDLVDQLSGMQVWILKTRKVFEDASTRKNVRLMVFGTLAALLVCGLSAFFINRQIGERQAVLNRLKSSEERFRFLAETANDAFITSDSAGRIVDMNPAAEGMFGYAKDELSGQSLVLLMPQKFTEEHGRFAFEKFVTLTSGLKAMELYGRRKDSTEFPLETSVSKWETREGVFFTTIVRDITERKFFIKTLLNNEHRLFQFLDAVPVAVMVTDPTGSPYYANQRANEIFGFNLIRGGKPSGNLAEAYHLFTAGSQQAYPEDRLPMVRALAAEKSHSGDMEFREGNRVIPLEAWGAPILDERGQVKYALSAFIDVTRQKEITESLEEREEFFRNLFEEGPIGMSLSFPDSILVSVNRAFCDMLGYSKKELTGQSFLDFTHPDDRTLDQSLTQKMFQKLIPRYQVEKRYLAKNGKTLWCKVTSSVIRDVEGEPLFRLSIIENVTDQKESENALKESEAKFRAVTESARDAIMTADAGGEVVYFNPAAVNMFGYAAEEIMGRPLLRLFPESVRTDYAPALQRLLNEDGTRFTGRSLETTGLRKDGTQFPLDVSLSVWYRDEGKFLTCIMRDITDRKQIEEMKQDLISVVSHQLKTPVAEINGFIENMLDGLTGALTPKQQEYLTDMREIGLENYRLISDLLNASKLERGIVTVELQPVPLQVVIDQALRDYEGPIRRKGLALAVETAQEGTLVLADRDKTVETLRNIINNALKCTDKGGITVRCGSENGYSWVEVKDTGIGMGPEALSQLFRKERVMGKEAARAGAGLGLYIAKNFMRLQKGDITVKSEKGKGTSFFVKIPNAAQEQGT